MESSALTPVRAHTAADGDWIELATRAGDGLEISLYWSKSADRVKIAVTDAELFDEFETDVANADALAAFYHPFAYAPSQSFGSVEAERESPNLRQQV